MTQRRHMAAAFGAAAIIATMALGTGTAQAQQRLYLSELTDLEAIVATVPHGSEIHFDEVDKTLKLKALAALGGYVELGPGQDPSPGGQAAVRVMGGTALRPDLYLRIDSETLAPVQFGDQASDDGWQSLTGRHRIWGRAGFGERGEGETSVELTAQAKLEHGQDPTRFMRPEIAAQPFYDRSAGATLWWRRGVDDSASWVWPIGYTVREVSYSDQPGQGFATHTLSSGMGIKPHTEEAPEGWIEFVGASWSRTAFEGQAVNTPCVPQQDCDSQDKALLDAGAEQLVIDQIDLRLLNVDRLIGIDDDIAFGIGFFLGGTWMWANDPAIEDVATATVGMHGNFYIFEDEDEIKFGMAVSRRGNHSPNGRQLLSDNRLEFEAAYRNRDMGLNVSHRSIIAMLADPNKENQEDYQPTGYFGLHTEWGFMFAGDFMLGMYHQARHGAPQGQSVEANPLTSQAQWRHELGAFIRYDGFGF